ncbi:putative ribonuclease H-like domain-containing protein [Tanacetum coccineum]
MMMSKDDAQKQVEDGLNNENVEQDKFTDDSSTKDVNAARQHVNTASPDVNTGSLKLNDVGPSVNTATHIESFSDEDEPKFDLGNITNSYTVPTTPNTRIHKDHPNDSVIGDVKSSVQTRRMRKPTSKQGFLSEVFRNKKDEKGIVIRNKASAFLYGTIEEEVYVTQPPGFKDPDYPDKVYKVVKALYGLHQAPRVWYEILANYLLENGFKRGKIDHTLFIKNQKKRYFACTGMCSMGELTFFLGLQVQQKEDGIFISQDKYVAKILKKFNYSDVKSASTLVDLEKPLVKDGDADDVDVHLYRSMIGSLMYLIASRPDIMFAVYACARFQVTPKTSHLLVVKRIFRYLKGNLTLGLWYSRDSPFKLVAYTDSDYAGATQDRKYTTGGCISKEAMTPRYLSLVVHLTKVGDKAVHKELGDSMERATAKVQTVNEVRQLQALVDKKRVIITESNIRRDLHLDDAEGTDCFPTATIFEELARMGGGKDFSGRIAPLFDTMMVQASEEVGEDSDHPTDSTQIPNINQPSTSTQPKKNTSSKKTQRQEAEVPQDETEHDEIDPEDASKQGRSIADLDDDVALVDETQERQDDELMFDTRVDEKDKQSTKLDDSTAGEAVTTASVKGSAAPTTIKEITLAQTLIQIKAAKPKVV